MITNECQYRITRAQVARFEAALSATATVAYQRTDMRLVAAQRDALSSQLDDLREELGEYERWKAADVGMITVSSFDELPLGLIRARLAAGLTQRELAERLDLKEQQIQKYECEFYRTASYQCLLDVASVLGVRIGNDILLPNDPVSFSELVSKLQKVGLDRSFLLRKLMSAVDVSRVNGEVAIGGEDWTLASVGSKLSRVFGWSPATILGHGSLDSPQISAENAHSRIPSYCDSPEARTYITYVKYLARVVAHGSSDLPLLSPFDDAQRLRVALLERYEEKSFRNILGFAWDRGIPVLPLSDSGKFHGACWRFGGRNVIVLKQPSNSESRWMFDLVHGLYHAGKQPHESCFCTISAPMDSAEQRNSEEEVSASQFAADVILGESAEELAQRCVSMAGEDIKHLRDAVLQISAANAIDVGALASYMAFRLSWQDIDWWDAAQGLEEPCAGPWETARDVFLERFPFALDNEVDRGLLRQALKGYEDDELGLDKVISPGPES